MQFKIIGCASNKYPIRGILLFGNSVGLWLERLQNLHLNLAEIHLYPIPDTTPNSIWGCFVLFKKEMPKVEPGPYEFVQQVSRHLFVVERADIFPAMTDAELSVLFSGHDHIAHPHFGVVELTEELDMVSLIDHPRLLHADISVPLPPTKLPSRIRSFQIHPLSQEQVLQNLEEKIVPAKASLKSKPLSTFEKIKLSVYDKLFKKDMAHGHNEASTTGWASFLKRFLSAGTWENIKEDFEDLSERNKKELDKLIELLKKNPSEALRYAIPLDEQNTSRGGVDTNGRMELLNRWFDFSLFRSDLFSGNAGKSIDLGNDFYTLQNQYRATAEELIKQKEYERAAFVYMKLLKQYDKAADIMELGKHYQAAATIHLKHTGRKSKAAECYEKGNMFREALAIYQELNENEKVGDLYIMLDNRAAAMQYFERVLEDLTLKKQYVKASLLSRNKMFDASLGQRLLREGWRKNADAVSCLSLYFANIPNDDDLCATVKAVYTNEVDQSNSEAFLQVIRNEYSRSEIVRASVREMAFEIIASKLQQNPLIGSELKWFNPENRELTKDVIRFKLNQKRTS